MIVFVLEFIKWIFLRDGIVLCNFLLNLIFSLVGVLNKIFLVVCFWIVLVIWGCVCFVIIGLYVWR